MCLERIVHETLMRRKIERKELEELREWLRKQMKDNE